MELSLREASTAVAVSVVLLIIIGVFSPEKWIYFFSIAMSWVLSDFILNVIVKGGGRIVQIPIIGTRTQFKGHGYIAFFIGIIFGTFFSTSLADLIYNLTGVLVLIGASQAGLPLASSWPATLVLSSIMAGLFVFVDFHVRFYVRDT